MSASKMEDSSTKEEDKLISESSNKSILSSKSEYPSIKDDDEQQLFISELYSCQIFVNWLNSNNLCWLNSTLAIISHNKILYNLVKLFPNCHIKDIIEKYKDAMTFLNNNQSGVEFQERIKKVRKIMSVVQRNTLRMLQPQLKFKIGEPESAFCALFNLLKEEKNIKHYLSITYDLMRKCKNCNTNSVQRNVNKIIVTLPNVTSSGFDPAKPVYTCLCCECKSDIELTINYNSLPACIIFHFEKGAGIGDLHPLSFVIDDREYVLVAIMTLKQLKGNAGNHFASWIRYPSKTYDDKWLNCNDLIVEPTRFGIDMPRIDMKNVFIYVYKTNDNKLERTIIKKSDNDTEVFETSKEPLCIDLE